MVLLNVEFWVFEERRRRIPPTVPRIALEYGFCDLSAVMSERERQQRIVEDDDDDDDNKK